MNDQIETIEEIAIIGMAGRFPGADNINQFWQNLRNGKESISRFTDEELLSRGVSPEQLAKPNYVKAGCLLSNIDMFDAAFFGYSAGDVTTMDPQHRLFLEICWEAMESAGYTPDAYPGAIGVFGGTSNSGFAHLLYTGHNQHTATERFNLMLGNDPDFFASRIAYKLNLKGPALTIQTACSTSLVAVHQACQSLLTYQCDMALSGGACVQVPQGMGYLYQDGMIFSPDGHCRAFDAQANGTVFGQGAGVVLLKRLSEALQDNDHIIAVIKGSAVNNDGALKAGFTAPSVDGQAEVIAMAQTVSEVDPATISYIEAHGTATSLGDPIEIEGLTKAFRQHCQNTNFCAIGSVKTNIGHLDTTAGIAGLIKTALALYHKEIPASLHFTTPNPKIDWENTPFFVNSQLRKWNSGNHPRCAGVSSFGVGGTNAHVIMEEAPSQYTEKPSRPYHLLLLSAQTPTALDAATTNLADFMRDNALTALADAAYTLQTGRKHFPHRRFTVCRTPEQAHEQLSSPESLAPISTAAGAPKGVVFMFSGQGSQYVNMGRDLYETEPFFRRQIDNCTDILKQQLNTDLRSILYPASTQEAEAQKRLTQTDITQPALFVIEYCLAQLLMHWGIHPTAMVGHSIGEYVAACLAGVFSLEDALRLVTARGRLMHSQPPGAMLAVPLPESEIQPHLTNGLSLAVVNGAQNGVLSGNPESIDALEKQLSEKKIHCRRLHTSHAFHSSMMDPILADFEKEVSLAHRNPPRIPFTSNVTGTWITEEQVSDPNYWAKHLRQTVHFFACMQTLLKTQDRTFIEIGPGQTLCTLIRQHPDCTKEHQVLATLRPAQAQKNDAEFLLNTLGRLWEAGHKINWQHFHQKEKRHRVPLPTYPFERKRYWPEVSRNEVETLTPQGKVKNNSQLKAYSTIGRPTESSRYDEMMTHIAQICRKLLVGVDHVQPTANFFDLGGDSLHAVNLFAELDRKTGINLPLATLFEAPTLGELAAKFAAVNEKPHGNEPTSGVATNDPWACLISIQPHGSKPPFFCVHGAGSNALNYRVFIKPLGQDQPLFGLQAKGLDGVSKPLRTIESMAHHYISEIRRIQHIGPYYIGGASFGGLVALEMAQQLIKQGQEIAFLAMFDTQGPSSATSISNPQKKSFHQKVFNYLSTLRAIPANKIFNRLMGFISFRLRFVKCAGYRLIRKPIPHGLRYWYLEQINIAAWHSYSPKYYKGHITLFRAYTKKDGMYDPTHGWKAMADKLTIEEIPGEHETFIEKPEVGVALKKHLLKAATL